MGEASEKFTAPPLSVKDCAVEMKVQESGAIEPLVTLTVVNPVVLNTANCPAATGAPIGGNQLAASL